MPASDPAAHRPFDAVAGFAHRQIIESALTEERATKASLEQRAFGVITTSGVVSTLLFGLAAFARQSDKVGLGLPEVPFLILALVGFVGAAGAALWAVVPQEYEEAAVKSLQERVEAAAWINPDVVEAFRRDAQLSVDILDSVRKGNEGKAKWLFAAVVAEVIAAAGVAGAVAGVLYHALS